MDAAARPHPFVGINQPITFHGATVVQYIPPSYASVTRDGGAAISTQPRDIMPGVSAMTCPPQYGSLFPLDNPSFTGDDHSTPRLAMDNGNCRSHEDEERPTGKETAVETLAVSAPPSYDDIFPLPLSDGST
ncbi:hypothetical protein AGOR_G00014290 [Albula goreensis]|uniref:Uncharacterized protein n=1 Tax=Albula goreensis TaxID=1534307 RepID=A0A8T3E720_9TELE|nr:hypothetical protein AGOR_G00014290 [Albula goreensis]